MASRLLAAAGTILLAVVTARAATESRDDARAEQEVRDAITRSVDIFNRHDAAAYADVFSERATITPLDKEVVGREEIRRFFEQAFRGELKDAVLKVSVLRLRLVRPDLAVCDMRETHPSQPKDPEEYLTAVMVREGDQWRIGAIRYTQPPPGEKEKQSEQQPPKSK